jgi:mannose-1-phosphate guanylyltransferase
MRAVILAGGKGTRLRPLTVYTPKPMIPVVNRPFLLYQLDVLSRAGITDITLSLSYQPDKIEDLLGNGSEFGVNLRFISEPTALGTAGAYRFAVQDEDGGPTLVMNGDILTDIDLSKLIEAHSDRNDAITIALANVPNPADYGLVELRPDGSVGSFIEKPKGDGLADAGASTVNAGIYILEPQVLDLVPKSGNSSFEYDVFPAAVERKLPFSGYVLDAEYWRDIGTPQTYLAGNMDLLSGNFGFEPIGSADEIETSPTAFIDSSSVLAEGCIVKPNARITNSVLGAGVHVEEKAVIENSVIWPYSRVSTFAEIHSSVVGRSCHIGRNAVLREGSVTGDKAMIPDYSVV